MKVLSRLFFVALAMVGWTDAGRITAAEPLKDYSFVRGVCYGLEGRQDILERDLGYARRLNLNSTRIWLDFRSYRQQPEAYLKKLVNYVRTAHRMGLSTMPILFNGNMMNPDILDEEFRKEGDAYVKAVVGALKDEPGLLLWDIMNEPTCNDYCGLAPAEERQARMDKVWNFVRYYCRLVKELDRKNAITVGVTIPHNLEYTADLVDVLSFHDYSDTRSRVQEAYDVARKVSEKYGKPMINSETGCPGRANSYDMAIELCEKNGAGWYLFNLIIGGYWGDIHGIVYPDGTVRDPSIIAALFGFYRNRDEASIVRPNPNKEGKVESALRQLERAMKDDYTSFRSKRSDSDRLLDAMEVCAHLLEGSGMVPGYDLPTARIRTWREQDAEKRDVVAIRACAYDMARTLKEYCQIF